MDDASDSDSGDIQHIKPAAVKPTLDLKNVPIWDDTISTRDNAQAIKISLGSAGYLDTTKGKGTCVAMRHANGVRILDDTTPTSTMNDPRYDRHQRALAEVASTPAMATTRATTTTIRRRQNQGHQQANDNSKQRPTGHQEAYPFVGVSPSAQHHNSLPIMLTCPTAALGGAATGAREGEGEDCHAMTPMEIDDITITELENLRPVTLTVSVPPCQPWSRAGSRLGWQDHRSHAFASVIGFIRFYLTTQPAPVRYIVENVPGAPDFPEILSSLGTGNIMRASACGSAGQSDTLMWTNIPPQTDIQNYVNNINAIELTDPGPCTCDLCLSEFSLFTPVVATDYFPKFVARPGSYAFRMQTNGQPGAGMVYEHDGPWSWADTGRWCEPVAGLRARAMAFTLDDLPTSHFSEAALRRLLGGVIDLNVMRNYIKAGSGAATAPPFINAGLTERSFRTIGECAQAMLLHAGLDHTFWDWAYLHAVYLCNRQWSSSVTAISYTLMTGGRNPDLTDLHVFGCVAWVSILVTMRAAKGKMKPKSWPGIYVGHHEDSAG
eukprot:jgi/Tetstr1/448787/TSEL_036021.t1